MKSLGWNWIYNHITCTDNVSEWRRDKSNGIWFSGVLLVHFLDKPPSSDCSLSPTLHLCSTQTSDLMVWERSRLDVRTCVRACFCGGLTRFLCRAFVSDSRWFMTTFFTRLHPPAALRPHPHKPCQYQSASAPLQPGGSQTHNRGL